MLAACSGFILNPTGAEPSSEPAKPPVEELTILTHEQVPWETMDNGWRRQVLFSGQLTLVILEATGPTSGPIETHSHPHDQISYLIEGDIEVQIGKEIRKISKGGFFRVPSNAPHGIQVLSKTATLMDTFTPPREDFRPKQQSR
jgi:quercetin dioxygenase-like cupin family protein